MRKPKLGVSLVVVCAVGALLGVGVGSAYASSSRYAESSRLTYGPVDGYTYFNSTSILVYPDDNWGEVDTYASHVTSSSVHTGYIGVRARMFRSADGSLVGQSGDSYNDTMTSAWDITWDSSANLHKSYYSSGISYAWNGSSYTKYYTYSTSSVASY